MPCNSHLQRFQIHVDCPDGNRGLVDACRDMSMHVEAGMDGIVMKLERTLAVSGGLDGLVTRVMLADVHVMRHDCCGSEDCREL